MTPEPTAVMRALLFLLIPFALAGCPAAPVAQPSPVSPAAAGNWVKLAESEREVISFDSAGARRTPEGRFAVRLRWALTTPHTPDETEPFAYDTYEADRDVDCAARASREGDTAWYLRGERVRFAMGLGHEGAPVPGSIGARALEALCQRLGGA